MSRKFIWTIGKDVGYDIFINNLCCLIEEGINIGYIKEKSHWENMMKESTEFQKNTNKEE